MISLPNWLFAALMYFAGIGFCVIAWGIWLQWDEQYTRRKDAHKGKKEEDEYKDLYDWMIEEIERDLQRGK